MTACTPITYCCGACHAVCRVEDMPTTDLWRADHLAALTAHFGPICSCCVDEYGTCEDCGAVTALSEMDDDRCPSCVPHYLAQRAADAADERFLSGRGYR